jgi:hypothetical protein
MGMSKGKKRKEKGKSYRGNNNRDEIGVKVKRQEKGEKEGYMERKAWKRVEEFRIGERIESDHLEIALRKRRGGKEQKRNRVGDKNKTVYFLFFWKCCFMFKEKCNEKS